MMRRRNKILQIIFIICVTSANSNAQTQFPSKNTNELSNKTTLISDEQEISNNDVSKVNNSNEKPTTPESGILSKIVNSISGSNKKDVSSLMYSDDEISKIQDALDAFKYGTPLPSETKAGNNDMVTTNAPEENAKSYIYLGSILYHSPDNWSVWINDQKISAQDNKPSNNLYIKSLDKDRASIVWTMSISKWKIITNSNSEEKAPINQNNQVEFDFILSFNQTYMLNNNQIVEGRVSSLSKESFKE